MDADTLGEHENFTIEFAKIGGQAIFQAFSKLADEGGRNSEINK